MILKSGWDSSIVPRGLVVQLVEHKRYKCLGYCDEFACNPVQLYNSLRKQAASETVTTSDSEIQKFNERNRTEWIPPVGIFTTLHLNP